MYTEASQCRRPAVLIVLAAGVGVAGSGSGCRGCDTRQGIPASQAAAAELDRQYEQYLTGDAEQARVSLAAASQPCSRLERGLNWASFLLHARLYCLDKYTGREDESVLEFTKAKYWLVLHLEVSWFTLKWNFRPSEIRLR